MVKSTEAVSTEYIHLNSCGCQHISGKDAAVLRAGGRVDYHILYIIAGTCYVVLGGREVAVKEGSLVFFFPKERQEYRFCGDAPTASYYLHFSGEAPKTLLKDIEEGKERVFEIGKSATLEELWRRTAEEYRLSLPESLGVTGGYLLAILSLCVRKVSFAGAEGTDASKKITAVCRHMLASLSKDLPVSEYARLTHLSESRFTHLFHEVMGKSPVRYVAELRVQRAKELLTDSALPVLEIAEAVGIRNPYYFSRFFKKQTGMSPSDYRRAHTQAI
ncbi:MAG: helix-turn-helix transcriptional regulator [Clostridia bacterium]|nr:helix-turn-helix transcriptional regulator [Clostridia bacterium]